jgi:poly-gamma-glutamate synthase PgsB/CapB
MRLILILVLALIVYGWIEYRGHLKALQAIPIRIHVNGTRGKSSVTRLIASGLRAGGIRTVAKTTGTRARFIFEDGREEPIVRHGKANVIEQLNIVRTAKRRAAGALVIECMAIRPELQAVSERRLIKATVGVITNVREDHLDEMGPTLHDIALALSLTIPEGGIVFTAERDHLAIIEQQALDFKAKVQAIGENGLPEDVMGRFGYIEHRENVALATAVCEFLGVAKATALAGMIMATPDPGALRRYIIRHRDKEIEFINAFAANDPQSTLSIWRRLHIRSQEDKPLLTILFNRGDRPDRAREFGKLIAHELRSDHCILVGDATSLIEHIAAKEGLETRSLINMAGEPPDKVFQTVVALTPQRSSVVGIGNIVGVGEEIAAYFESMSVTA